MKLIELFSDDIGRYNRLHFDNGVDNGIADEEKINEFMDVLKRFNIEPNDVSLFEHAFSHSSFVNENRGNHVDYERIEFN